MDKTALPLGRGRTVGAGAWLVAPTGKAQVAAFMESLGLRPRDAGAFSRAHALDWAGLLLGGVARNGADFDLALATEVV